MPVLLSWTFFNDSYEVYGADWTPDFLEQFARRRGYKLEEHFPEFIAQDRNETTARIVSDYRETISDLLIENFSLSIGYWNSQSPIYWLRISVPNGLTGHTVMAASPVTKHMVPLPIW